MKRVPKFLRKYFWDVDFRKLDLDKSRFFILRRILEFGDERATVWMNRNFSRGEISKLFSFARLEPKSANFWALILGIKKENVLCLKKRYLAIRRKIWPY